MSREGDTRLVYSTEQPAEVPRRRRSRRGPAPPSAATGGVRLRLDRRASGRVVTVVTGLPGGDAELAAVGRELRNACGTGGTVKSRVVELQGDQRERVEAFLSERGLRYKRSGG